MIPKFRAFLKDTKKIADVKSIFFEIGIVMLSNDKFYQFEDIILMQSTGLRDKNGVEIFEGDICRVDGKLQKYLIVFEKGCFFGRVDYPSGASGLSFIKDVYHKARIIGNIYENGELLEGI